jgi:hypothetical protein
MIGKIILVVALSAATGAAGQKMVDQKASQNVPTIEETDSIPVSGPATPVIALPPENTDLNRQPIYDNRPSSEAQ